MVNIEGLKKAEVLAALYNGSKPLGMGIFQFTHELMTTEEADELLIHRGLPVGYTECNLYFDYLKGRVMKVDLSSATEFEEWGYDRDNGAGAAQRIIDEVRSKDKSVTVSDIVNSLSEDQKNTLYEVICDDDINSTEELIEKYKGRI